MSNTNIVLCIFILAILSCIEGSAQVNRPAVLDTTIELHRTSLYFDSDEWNIRPSEFSKVNQLMQFICLHPKAIIQITGHADEIGATDYNLKLSMERARSIRTTMETRDTNCIFAEIAFYGEGVPKAKGTENLALQENRRVDVMISMKKKLIRLTGVVLNEIDLPLGDALVKFKSKTHAGETHTDSLGEFIFYSPAGEDVELSVLAKDHFYFYRNIGVAETLKLRKMKMILPTLELNKKFVANRLYFHGNRSILLSRSFDELERIELTMKLNDKYCFEVAGHINRPNELAVDRTSWNFGLSVARALTIYDSLINSGISENRLFAKGYGNWNMLFPKGGSQQKEQSNRRVEIAVRPCETVAVLKNDTVANRSSYGFDPMKKKFHYFTHKLDVRLFDETDRETIYAHVRYLKSIHHDPYRYTYHELLNKQVIPENISHLYDKKIDSLGK